MTKRLKELPDVRSIVTALGGEQIVARVTGVTFKAVNNWSNWGEIPAVYHNQMMWDLNQLGYTASPKIWRQIGRDGLRIRRVLK